MHIVLIAHFSSSRLLRAFQSVPITRLLERPKGPRIRRLRHASRLQFGISRHKHSHANDNCLSKLAIYLVVLQPNISTSGISPYDVVTDCQGTI
jgi:hypothetical protein